MLPDRERRPRREGGAQSDGANVKAIVTGAAVAELLDISDERDRHLARRHQAWREGWRLGCAAGYEAGYLQCASDVKRAEHAIYDHLAKAGDLERARWTLRGQARTRKTFGRPHKDDFTGRGDAA
jgi:hypothetical protein